MKNKKNLDEKLKITLTEYTKSLDFPTDISEELKEMLIPIKCPKITEGHKLLTAVHTITK